MSATAELRATLLQVLKLLNTYSGALKVDYLTSRFYDETKALVAHTLIKFPAPKKKRKRTKYRVGGVA